MIYGQPNSPLPNWCAALGLGAAVCWCSKNNFPYFISSLKFTCTPTLNSSQTGLKISRLNRDSNDYKPVDAEIEDNKTGIFQVFETQILSYQDPHFKHGLGRAGVFHRVVKPRGEAEFYTTWLRTGSFVG